MVDDGFILSVWVLAFFRGGSSRGVGSCDVGWFFKFVVDVLLYENVWLIMEDFEFVFCEVDFLMIFVYDYYESVGERCLIWGVEVDVVVTSDDFNDLIILVLFVECSGGIFLFYLNV